MDINQLPDIILSNILQSVCGDCDCSVSSSYRLKHWSPKLVLLEVCRRWRELGISGVHRNSFISTGYTVRRAQENVHTNDHSPDESSQGSERMYTAKSNLDIIPSSSSSIWARNIRIYINSSYNPLNAIRCLLEMLGKHSHLLTKVRRMNIFFDFDHARDEQASGPGSVSKARILGDDMAQFFPLLQFIELFGVNTSPETLNFARTTIKGFAHKLTGFMCPQHVLTYVTAFSDRLRDVEINGHADPLDYFPPICPDNIVSLTLEFIQRSFYWSSFEGVEGSRILRFPNLKWFLLKTELEVPIDNRETGDWAHSAIRFRYRIVAPKLHSVVTNLCPFTLSLLSSIQGPTTIEHVALTMDNAHLYFAHFNLNAARELFSSYADASQNEIQLVNMYDYMNDIFNVPNIAGYTTAEVGFYGQPLHIERIDWNYLKEIELYCKFNVRDLRALLAKIPSLEVIHIDKPVIRAENGDIIVEIQDEESVVESIVSKINTVNLANEFDYTDEEMDKLTRYIDKLIPGSV